ncbi:MAG: GNAT family N-acetyltransferase [Pseudomonadota bacterium]
MSDLPLTRVVLSEAQQVEIRDAVRHASGIPFEDAPSRLAMADDAGAFLRFLSDPAIHGPIYNLPSPLNAETVTAFIRRKLEQRSRGEGLLFLRFDSDREVIGYSELDIWPEWGAGDLGGALRPDQQGKRAGVSGAKRTFTWMFEVLRLRLIVATGALDNVRTARMLDGLGFERKGEITSHRPDGGTRASRVWEVTRAAWFDLHQ